MWVHTSTCDKSEQIRLFFSGGRRGQRRPILFMSRAGLPEVASKGGGPARCESPAPDAFFGTIVPESTAVLFHRKELRYSRRNGSFLTEPLQSGLIFRSVRG